MRTLKAKVIVSSVVVVAVVLVALLLFQSLVPDRNEPRYITTPVVRADIEDTVLAAGTAEAGRQVSVGTQVSGQVKSLKVALGDTVRKGQLIAEIDAQTQQDVLKKAQSSLAQMRAQMRAKEANLEQARLKLQREERLRASDANSRESQETALAAWQAASADIDALREQIDQARITVNTEAVNLGYTRIAAPIDGTVVAVVTREGQTVNSAQLTPTIVVLAALDTMTVKVQVSEADIAHVRPGQPVVFSTLGDADHRYTSQVRTVELAPDAIGSDARGARSTANAAPVYFNVSFDVPNPDNRLRIAMTVQASIVLAVARQALVIPVASLGHAGADGRYPVRVLQMQDGRSVVTTRQVRIGIRNVSAQVLDGLQEGEQVIIGQHQGTPLASILRAQADHA